MNDAMINRLATEMHRACNRWHGGYATENDITRDFLSALTPADLASLVAEKCWQPIETVTPEDERFLATLPVHRADTKAFWYTEYHIIWLEYETGRIHEDAYQGWDLNDYEHWMRLPAAPAPGGE